MTPLHGPFSRDGAWVRPLLERMRGRRIAVIGDLMLDEWLWGAVRRISPEAPVPIVEVQNHSYTLGGAGNVVNNLTALGAKVDVVGVVGDDEAGERVIGLCRQLGVAAAGICRVRSRPTTQKTRIVAHNQQVVRADRESTQLIDQRTRERLCRRIEALDGRVHAAIVSDYGKGLVGASMVKALRDFRRKVVITGDPKPRNLTAFRGIDCIAPNTQEVEIASGIAVNSETDLARAAGVLLRRTRCRYVLITRGEHGMTLFARDQNPFTVPAAARQVYDVSGAGDTVMSTLTLALAVSAPIERAVTLATFAAGVVVEKLGTATASAEEIERFAMRVTLEPKSSTPARESSIPLMRHARTR